MSHDGKEYLQANEFLRELMKEISFLLESYGFVLVEWKREENKLILTAEREGKKMELRFELHL